MSTQAATRTRAFQRRPCTVPSILQIEAVECGAVSLAMVLAHFGAWIPLERLRALAGVSRDGSKATNLLKAARNLGLNAKGYKKEPADLANVPWPAILHWNFNHFVVLEGLTDTHAFISDPAMGRRKISRQELDESFTGVVLTFEPAPDFKRTARPQGLLSALKQRLRHSRLAVGLAFLLSVVVLLPALVMPTYTKLFVDGVIIRNQIDWFPALMGLFLLTALFHASLVFVQSTLLLELKRKLTIIGVGRFMWHVLHLPMSFFTQRSSGEIASRIKLSEDVASVISGPLAEAIVDIFSILVFGSLLIAFDPFLGSIVVVSALPNIISMIYVRRKLFEPYQTLSVETGKLAGMTAGLIDNIESIKASGRETSFFSQWAGQHAKTLESSRVIGVTTTIMSIIPDLLTMVVTAIVLGVGSHRVIEGHLSIGDLMAFMALSVFFTEPVNQVMDAAPVLNSAEADLVRVEDAFRNAASQEPADPAPTPRAFRGTVELRSISFGYNPVEPPLVEDVNLTINPGERIALVGSSGSGKSTIGRIICGIYTPWSGSVLFDGIEASRLTSEQKARNIGYVDQEIFLFEGTVRENLTMWNPEVPDDVLTRALEDAAMLDEITARKGELDARVEEGGRNFSGGQRQRLEIARALVADPAILILDEATAALDPVTEKLIDDNLRRRGCTCIIIAHRLSTVRDCSEIIVLSSGRITERGTHETLMALDGDYANLIRTA